MFITTSLRSDLLLASINMVVKILGVFLLFPTIMREVKWLIT